MGEYKLINYYGDAYVIISDVSIFIIPFDYIIIFVMISLRGYRIQKRKTDLYIFNLVGQ